MKTALVLAVAAAGAVSSFAAQRPESVYLRPATARPKPAPQKQPPAVAGEDFYESGGARVRLQRSATELVVKFRANTPGTPADVLARVAPSAKLAGEARAEGRGFHIVSVPRREGNDPSLRPLVENLRQKHEFEFVSEVLIYPPTNVRMLPTDEIVVKLGAGVSEQQLSNLAGTLGLNVDRPIQATTDEFVLRLADPKDDPLEKARALNATGRLAWAEPNFIRQYRKYAVPNDARFGQQWHLSNTGQGSGTVGADVKAPAAWDTQTGSSAITIAIIDDGVEITHEDLSANIFTNPGEIPGNGIDDDVNGYVDDVNGWDFYNGDNGAVPSGTDDNHGTAVAGVAAARGNNGLGVSGACQTCKLLPVKIFSPDYAGDAATANAIRYAASFADVLNNSWGGGAPSAALQSAIQYATTSGRGGRGSTTLFASGNDASGMFLISTNNPVPAGTHKFRWSYEKDLSLSDGDDGMWLAWALFPGGELVNFEGGTLPAGWSTGGSAAWAVTTDPRHSDESKCLTRAARSGDVYDGEWSELSVVKTVPQGRFYSFQWVSSEEYYDGLYLEIDLNNDGSWDLGSGLISGVPWIDTAVSYPAAYAEAIAVGASSNNDCRSYYSQYGSALDIVAPSNGGPLNLAIETTDRMGANGYDAANYAQAAAGTGFGGTSSATPLASGVAGLLLSRNPSLTAAQVQTALQSTAAKVGGEPYVLGRNDRYGHGRIDAQAALLSISACASVAVSPAVVPAAPKNSFYSVNFTASGGTPAYVFSVPVGTLPPGMTLSSGGTLSGTPTTQGTYSFTVVSVDANACMGYRAIRLVVTPPVAPPTGTSLYLVTPCRVIDTRNPVGAFGGPAVAHLGTRNVQLTGVCGIPSTAKAVAVNLTAIAPSTAGFLSIYPAGTAWPGNSTLNYRLNKTRANNTIAVVSALGQVTVLNNGALQHFVMDVTGYFQ